MKKLIVVIVLVIVVFSGLSAWQLTKTKKAPLTIPKKLSSQVLPVGSNPIQNSSQAPGLVVLKAAAEDNTEPTTKQTISDRLQLTIQNVSTQKISNLEVYYSMKDAKTGQSEAYYQKLGGLQLAPNEIKTVSFDNETGAGHYPENKYSLYRSSQNEVDFTIKVSTPVFKPVEATAKKSAGTGETAG